MTASPTAAKVGWRHRLPIAAEYIKLCNGGFWADPEAWDPAIFSWDGPPVPARCPEARCPCGCRVDRADSLCARSRSWR